MTIELKPEQERIIRHEIVLPYVAKKKQSLVRSGPVLARHPCQRRIDLRQAVGAAARVAASMAEKQVDARFVMLVVAVECRDQNGRIEECLHSASPDLRRSRRSRPSDKTLSVTA